MITWIYIIGASYLIFLGVAAFISWRKATSADDYVFAGSNIGAVIGLFTYAATLFSTFTLMGMPDFFRVHGVGAWVFLAVSDGAMVFLIVWFGYHLRRRAREKGYQGTAGLVKACYESKWAGYVYFLGAFIFLIPYVAIQIRGLAIFLEAVFPGALPAWGWSFGIIVLMLIYSEIGGLRAIIYSDILQGAVLLIVTWIVAVGCILHFGSVPSLFDRVANINLELLSIPGPEGLFTRQFLFASLLAIVFLPVTQPQLTTRIIIMRNRAALNRMAVAIGCFAILIILPTAFIGMYGAVNYGDDTTRDFLAGVLLFEQSGVIAATVIVGLLAAAMSTADSQIFALGTELRSLISGSEKAVMLRTKLAIAFFGFAAFAFSIVSGDQLVLLARVSFAGTAIMGPMILTAVLTARTPGREIVVATGLGLVLFIASLVELVPGMIGPIRLDLLLIGGLGLVALASTFIRQSAGASVADMEV